LKVTIETRTFVGETATSVGDGFTGFRIGQSYQLRYRVRKDGNVAVALDHAPQEGRELIVTSEQFEKWFRK
jgi:hypothetical protein